MKKRTILSLATAGLLVGGSLVAAQVTGGTGTGGAGTGGVQSEGPKDDMLQTSFLRGRHGSGFDGFGVRGGTFGRLALGTTVDVTFSNGDPAAGGNVTDTLPFTYGEDSEVAFAQALAEAQQNAQYVTVNVGEQTRTVDLSQVTLPDNGRGLLPRELSGEV